METVVLPISLSDELVVYAVNDRAQFRTLSLSLEVTGDPDIVRRVPADESNLALRAARVLAEGAGVRGFAEIQIHKRIPVAAGLGGGSADAAATLAALNTLWGLGISLPALTSVSAVLGSDVPAMLHGPSLVRGLGENVVAIQASQFEWALVTFNFGISTRDAYAWWDEDGAPVGPDLEDRLMALRHIPDELARALYNDLERPVAARHSRIREAQEVLLEGGAVGAVMTGSGSSVVGLLQTGSRLQPWAEHDLESITGRPVQFVTSRGSEPEPG